MPRRALLTGAVAGAGVLAGGAVAAARPAQPPPADFHGAHQVGIVSPPLPYLAIAGFDVVAPDRVGLVGVLRTWTGLAEELTGDGRSLTVTFGFGPALFADRRFGLSGQRPAALTPLPAFAGEAIDPLAGDGDLCVQVCADTPAAAHRAVRALLNAARSGVALRWRQTGFRDADGTAHPRDLFGFRDGTANLDPGDPAAAAQLWVDTGPTWLHGGSYLVMRRIRLLLDTWDRVRLADRERAVGRRQDSNERVAGVPTAHASLASPARNAGAKLLRRSYSYDAGVDPNGLMDAGVIFLCFQRDPGRQFVPIQRRLAGDDALNAYSQHRASGLYACPPGIRPGSFVGAELFS